MELISIPFAYIITVIAALASIIAGFYWREQKRNAAEVEMQKSRILTLEAQVEQSLFALEKVVNRTLAEKNLPPFQPIAPVLPLPNSPLTKNEVWTARIGTQQARLARAYDLLGLSPVQVDNSPTSPEDFTTSLRSVGDVKK